MRRTALVRVAALALGVLVAAALVAWQEQVERARQDAAVLRVRDPPELKYAIHPRDGDRVRGWREHVTPTPTSPGVQRVVAVGDSVTYGVAVAGRQAWPAALREALTGLGSDRRVEVFNFGVNGYDAGQVAALIDTRLAAWEPDLVVWAAYNNDAWPTLVLHSELLDQPVFVASEAPSAVRLLPAAASRWMLTHSALWRRLVAARTVRAVAAQGTPLGAPEGPDAFLDAALERIVAWQSRTSSPVLVLATPPHVLARPDRCEQVAATPERCAGYLRRHERLLQRVAASGLAWVDLLPALQAGEADAYHPPGGPDDHHPGAAGHALFAAAALDAVLQELGPPTAASEPRRQRPTRAQRRAPVSTRSPGP